MPRPPKPAAPRRPGDLPGLRAFVSYPRGGAAHGWAEQVHAFLERRGAEVWRDERSIEPGDDDWYRRIVEGLERADAAVCIVGADSDGCRWQQREMLHADRLGLPVVALAHRAGRAAVLHGREAADRRRIPAADADAGAGGRWPRRCARTCPAATAGRPARAPTPARRRRNGRRPTPGAGASWPTWQALLHVDYSDREERYVPVEGREQRSAVAGALAQGPAHGHRRRADARLRARCGGSGRRRRRAAAPRRYADVLDALRDLPRRRVRRLAVLGEPGAGKSFSLERIACDCARRACADAAAPLPLLVRLGLWTREAEPLQGLRRAPARRAGTRLRGAARRGAARCCCSTA